MVTPLFFASLSLFCYISSPVTDMRQQPKLESEIVSQAYFSEEVKPLEEAGEWIKIETIMDHYQGWIQKSALFQRERAFLSHPSAVVAKVIRCAAHLYAVQETIYGPILTLPFDSKLEVLKTGESDSRWIKVSLVDDREAYVQRGDVSLNQILLNRHQICTLSMQFLGLPYTWGGRSSFGYDCSGFVQMLYRQMGVALPRDAKDQIGWSGLTEIPLEQAMAGDLIFFGRAEDDIRHVGMSLGDDRFVHATVAENAPYIRVSRLSTPEWSRSGRFLYRVARTLKQIREPGHDRAKPGCG